LAFLFNTYVGVVHGMKRALLLACTEVAIHSSFFLRSGNWICKMRVAVVEEAQALAGLSDNKELYVISFVVVH